MGDIVLVGAGFGSTAERSMMRRSAVARFGAAMLAAIFAVILGGTASAHPPVGIAPRAPSTTPRAQPRSTPVTSWLDDVRAHLVAQKLDGWLLSDNRGQNPLASDILQPRGPLRRWFYLIPAAGEPQLLAHADDAVAFDAPRPLTYRTWRDLDAQLKVLVRGKKRLAMEYAPRLPALSRVDAGTLELVRAAGVQVVSSADLLTLVRARWTDAQERSHRHAAAALASVKEEVFAFIARGIGKVTEYDAQQLAQRSLSDHNLEASDPPIVAAGAHSADPRYVPTPERSERIAAGDVVLLTLAARARSADAIYADQTWVGYVGDRVPDEAAHLFAIVRDVRQRVQALIVERATRKLPLRGFEIDDAARAVAVKAGFGDRYLMRTGHSLDTRRWGDGADLDDGETRDDRLLIARTGYVVEPGLYVAGAFGVRSSVDLFVAGDGVHVTPEPPQTEIELIRK
ncbi:MAG: peptidase [Myxococcales bacterium]|nr:peptidase [Myxococcales bacterium]